MWIMKFPFPPAPSRPHFLTMLRIRTSLALEPEVIRDLRRRLFRWYARGHRDLPWRRSRDPYAILVSEFMLQQTRVAAVLPRYDVFLRRFPTLAALARAPEEEVRAAWSGLGYYRRARNLHASARLLLKEHAGELPDRVETLRKLPGVGPYTAAALASIVHGVPKAVVDGNVIRVLTRLTADGRSVSRAPVRRDLDALADLLIDPARAGDWNQAVMELGATVCLPAVPQCDACPWISRCRARALGTPEKFPGKEAARAPVPVERAVGVFRRKRTVLLVRRRDARVLDGTWEFPGLDVAGRASAAEALAGHLETWLGREVRVGALLVRARHAITHHRIDLRAFSVHADPAPRARAGARIWVTAEELERLSISSMTRKIMDGLEPPPKNPR